MPSANRILLASAGSGKTEFIVKESCGDTKHRSTLITYTINGRNELSEAAYEKFGCIPPHVSISTWYSFVLTHFVRPYQNYLYAPRVQTINFDRPPDVRRYVKKEVTGRYYFSSEGKMWSDRVTDFACQIIDRTGGMPVRRIESIFDCIYIDEAQDLSGWDLELIEHLLRSKTKIVLVGDHRQATYPTNDNPKNRPYRGEKIVLKFKEWDKAHLAEIEYQSLSHRCIQVICDVADRLFPDLPPTKSLNNQVTPHDGVFLIPVSQVDRYFEEFNPQPLRWSVKTPITHGNPLNFGEAKGMTFERTLIFPHERLRKYVETGQLELDGESLTKSYVAVTRARQSVGIVVPDEFNSVLLPHFIFK